MFSFSLANLNKAVQAVGQIIAPLPEDDDYPSPDDQETKTTSLNNIFDDSSNDKLVNIDSSLRNVPSNLHSESEEEGYEDSFLQSSSYNITLSTNNNIFHTPDNHSLPAHNSTYNWSNEPNISVTNSKLNNTQNREEDAYETYIEDSSSPNNITIDLDSSIVSDVNFQTFIPLVNNNIKQPAFTQIIENDDIHPSIIVEEEASRERIDADIDISDDISIQLECSDESNKGQYHDSTNLHNNINNNIVNNNMNNNTNDILSKGTITNHINSIIKEGIPSSIRAPSVPVPVPVPVHMESSHLYDRAAPSQFPQQPSSLPSSATPSPPASVHIQDLNVRLNQINELHNHDKQINRELQGKILSLTNTVNELSSSQTALQQLITQKDAEIQHLLQQNLQVQQELTQQVHLYEKIHREYDEQTAVFSKLEEMIAIAKGENGELMWALQVSEEKLLQANLKLQQSEEETKKLQLQVEYGKKDYQKLEGRFSELQFNHQQTLFSLLDKSTQTAQLSSKLRSSHISHAHIAPTLTQVGNHLSIHTVTSNNNTANNEDSAVAGQAPCNRQLDHTVEKEATNPIELQTFIKGLTEALEVYIRDTGNQQNSTLYHPQKLLLPHQLQDDLLPYSKDRLKLQNLVETLCEQHSQAMREYLTVFSKYDELRFTVDQLRSVGGEHVIAGNGVTDTDTVMEYSGRKVAGNGVIGRDDGELKIPLQLQLQNQHQDVMSNEVKRLGEELVGCKQSRDEALIRMTSIEKTLEDTLQRNLKERAVYEANLSDATHKNYELEGRVVSLQREKEELLRLQQELQHRIETSNSNSTTTEHLNSQIDYLNTKIGIFQHEIQRLNDEINQLTTTVSRLQKELEVKTNECKLITEQSSQMISRQEQEVKRCSEDLVRYRKEMENLSAAKMLLEQQNLNLTAQTQELVSARSLLTKEVEVYRSQSSQTGALTSQISALKQQLQTCETETRQLHQIIAQLRQARKTTKEDIDLVITERDTLKLTVESQKLELEKLSQVVSKKSEENESFTQVWIELVATRDKLQSIQSESEIKIRGLEATVEELRSLNGQLQQREYDLKSAIEVSSADTQIFKQDILRLETELRNLHAALRTMQNERDGLKIKLHQEHDSYEEKIKSQIMLQQDLSDQRNAKYIEELKTQILDLNAKVEEECLLKRKVEMEMRAEKARMQKAFETAMRSYQNTQEDNVDRALITNLIITYFKRNKSKEILELISKILAFNEEQQVIVGLRQPKTMMNSLFSSLLGVPAPVEVEGDNLAELWVNFLLHESDSAQPSPPMATSSHTSTALSAPSVAVSSAPSSPVSKSNPTTASSIVFASGTRGDRSMGTMLGKSFSRNTELSSSSSSSMEPGKGSSSTSFTLVPQSPLFHHPAKHLSHENNPNNDVKIVSPPSSSLSAAATPDSTTSGSTIGPLEEVQLLSER